MIKFKIPGKVKAKQSFKIGKNRFKYIDSEVLEYANFVRLCFMKKYPKWNIQNYTDKALKVQIDVYMNMPKSFNKKKQEQALKDEIRPITKPDCDNLAKSINDALNGIVYPDDKQIACLQVNKYYALSDSALITIDLI